jgi:hypothetical protein
MAGSAGGHEHVASGERSGIRIQAQEFFLCRKEDTVAGFFVNFDL